PGTPVSGDEPASCVGWVHDPTQVRVERFRVVWVVNIRIVVECSTDGGSDAGERLSKRTDRFRRAVDHPESLMRSDERAPLAGIRQMAGIVEAVAKRTVGVRELPRWRLKGIAAPSRHTVNGLVRGRALPESRRQRPLPVDDKR